MHFLTKQGQNRLCHGRLKTYKWENPKTFAVWEYIQSHGWIDPPIILTIKQNDGTVMGNHLPGWTSLHFRIKQMCIDQQDQKCISKYFVCYTLRNYWVMIREPHIWMLSACLCHSGNPSLLRGRFAAGNSGPVLIHAVRQMINASIEVKNRKWQEIRRKWSFEKGAN